MKIDFEKLPVKKEYVNDSSVEKWSCQVTQCVEIKVEKHALFPRSQAVDIELMIRRSLQNKIVPRELVSAVHSLWGIARLSTKVYGPSFEHAEECYRRILELLGEPVPMKQSDQVRKTFESVSEFCSPSEIGAGK